MMEKSLQELQRDLRSLHKLVDHQAMQILNVSRYQQKTRLEEQLVLLSQEVLQLKEDLSIQSNLVRWSTDNCSGER